MRTKEVVLGGSRRAARFAVIVSTSAIAAFGLVGASSARAAPGGAAGPSAAAPFFPTTMRFVVDPVRFCRSTGVGEYLLTIRLRTSDSQLSVAPDLVRRVPCGTRNGNVVSYRLQGGAFPVDEEDDFWLHAMLFDFADWELLRELPFNGLERFPGLGSVRGIIDYDLLGRLHAPLGSGTALLPVAPGATNWVVVDPARSGDTDGDTFSTTNRYVSFHDCGPADREVSPFERERLEGSPDTRDNNCDGIFGAQYQRLLISTAGELAVPAQGNFPTGFPARLRRLFHARHEDVVSLLRSASSQTSGRLHLSHIAFNASKAAKGLRDEDVDAVIAVDRPVALPGVDLQAGDLIISFASKVQRSQFGAAGQALPQGAVQPTDLVRYRRTGSRAWGGTFHPFFDGSAVGLNNEVPEDVDAAELVMEAITVNGVQLEPGDLLLSTSGQAKVPKVGGGNLRPKDEDVFVFRANQLGGTTGGRFELLVKGSSAWKKNLDALALVEFGDDLRGLAQRGDLLVSTSAQYSIEGRQVKAQDLAVWRLAGEPSLLAVLAGDTVGLKQTGEDVDAVDFDRFAALSGQVCDDPRTMDGKFQCERPFTDRPGTPRLAARLIAPAEYEGDSWLEDLPFGNRATWGWDQVRPGSYGVDFLGIGTNTLLGTPLGFTFYCLNGPVEGVVPGPLPVEFQVNDLHVNNRRVVNISTSADTPEVVGITYQDVNGNALPDQGERRFDGLGLRLYRDNNRNGAIDPGDTQVWSTTSSTTGSYSLSVPLGGFCGGPFLLDYDLPAAKTGVTFQPIQPRPLRLDFAGGDLNRQIGFRAT